jgi:hypothetical protein
MTHEFERLKLDGNIGLDEQEVTGAPEFEGVIVPTEVPRMKLKGLPE